MAQLNLTERATLAEYPAYRVVERETVPHVYVGSKWHDVEHTTIKARDVLGTLVKSAQGDYWNTYQAHSVVSYTMENNEDPIAAVERAKSLGHQLHWINEQATVISARQRAQETIVAVHDGMIVRFEGVLFKVRVFNGGRAAKLEAYTPE